MLDKIPLEILADIIKRLPIRSLIQLQFVCKTLKTLIASSDFIKHYTDQMQQQQQQQQLLLVSYMDPVYYKHNYVTFVDDHTFPLHKLSHTAPPLVKNLINHKFWIIASSHGLLCFYSQYYYDNGIKDVAVLWNISIGKAIAVVKPGYECGGTYGTAIGFGVCRETGDPKIVKVTYVDQRSKVRMESETSCVAPLVEVFTLSTRVWRSSYGNLPRRSVHFFPHKGVVINGVYYWLATDEITVDGDYKFMIVSFDMTTEEFGEVILPNSLARMGLHLSKLGGSLAVVGFDVRYLSQHFDVWMIRDGVPKSFTKLFTFTLTTDDVFLGFRKSGEPIIEIPKEGEDDCGHLSLYDPYSDHVANIGIDGRAFTFNVFDYKETLLLLDHPNLMVYNGI